MAAKKINKPIKAIAIVETFISISLARVKCRFIIGHINSFVNKKLHRRNAAIANLD